MSPYEGTDGWSGSETSRGRAHRDTDSGRTQDRHEAVVRALVRAGSAGMTWVDVGVLLDVHHGSSSGVLSNLHQEGKVTRTSRVRDGSKVYVLPQFLRDDDTTEAYRPNRNRAQERVTVLEDRIERATVALAEGLGSTLFPDEGSARALRILQEEA